MPALPTASAVAVPVVLALVHFARLDAGDPAASRVNGDPGLEDHLPVGPVPDLGAEHRCIPGLGRAPEQLLQGVGRRLAVIVQQPHPLHALRRRAGPPDRERSRSPRGAAARADRGAVAGTPLHAEDDRLAQQAGEDGAAAIPAAGVDGDDALHRPGLIEQRLDDARQPRGTVMRDDHRRDDVLRICIVRRQVGPLAAAECHLQAGGGACAPAVQGSGTP